MKNKISIKNGVFFIDGRPHFLLSSDYPYYRDRVEHWQDRLLKIKEAGIDIITAYIPWRHHAFKKRGRITYDFTGRTQGNRNLKKFIEVTAKTGLYLILKPGPFVHAELNFGGLPDWVCPEENKTLQPMLDFENRPVTWCGKILPSPLDENFMKMVQAWLGEVDEKIFSKNIYPAGNLIAVQLTNEGIYSDASNNIFAQDYASFFSKANAGKQDFFYRKILQSLKKSIKSKIPVVINVNPPPKRKC